MRFAAIAAAIVSIVIAAFAPAWARPSPSVELVSTDAVLRWINAYRAKPDPAGVPSLVQALSRFGAFKDPENAGVYVGFIAGVIGSNPARAEDLIGRMLPLPAGDQWMVVRAIAYSGHPEWKSLLRKFADRMPSRQVMIDKHIAGTLPTLYQVAPEKRTSAWQTMRSYVSFDKSKPAKDVALEPSPELLDTFWGYYFATGAARPISRIIGMLPWSKDNDSIDKLMLGSMAKYTLASNAARDPELLAMLKRAREHHPKEATAVINEVIDAAETVETARLRREAMAAIEELRRKGPGYRRNISWWGQLGQGALAVGCIAAAATGHVELGLPCVITGGVSSAALGFWEKQQP
ncbi:MAG: hypothetical protein QOC56_1896 [Alphaproteobacteria bacterium]|nr:hypothetical protein [Alphaproteobacteria bacterium]